MVTPQQGDLWWAESEDKRRPVLVVTRSTGIEALRWLLIAPVTRSIRGIPTEIRLGEEQGLRQECVAAFDNLQPIRKTYLTDRVGALGPGGQREICRALNAMADC